MVRGLWLPSCAAAHLSVAYLVKCPVMAPGPLPDRLLQALPGQQTPEGVPSFKLVLVGDGGTGVHTSILCCWWLIILMQARSCACMAHGARWLARLAAEA